MSGIVINPFVFAAVVDPVSYIGSAAGVPSSNVFTYSNAPIDTDAGDIVVVGHFRESTGASSTTSVVCDATTLTLFSPGAQHVSFLNESYLEIFYGVPGALSTANIVSTTSGVVGVRMFVLVVRGCNSTPLDAVASGSASGTSIALNDIQTAIDGALIAFANCQQASVTFTESWTGSETVTEDFDSTSPTGNSEIAACHFATTAAGTTDDLTFTISASRTHVGAAISFGP